MTHIPVMVMVVDEVMPSGSVDKEMPDMMGKIQSCFRCGGLLFYQRITTVEGTDHATDTESYCAQCGQFHHGYFDDPFDEMEISKEQKEFESKYDERFANYIMEATEDEVGPSMEWVCIDVYPYEKFEKNRAEFLKPFKYFRFREVNLE